MARNILTVTLIAIIYFAAHAQRVISLSDDNIVSSSSSKVERSVVPTSQGYHVRYDFKEAVLIPDDLFPELDIWHIEGFENVNIPKEPNCPYHSDSFTIPAGKTASVRIINEEWVSVNSLPSPGRPTLMVSDTTGYTRDSVQPIRDTDTNWYPLSPVTDNGTTTYKGIDIINIGISPVQFNISTGKARVCKTIEYEVLFSSDNSKTNVEIYSNSIKNKYPDDAYLSATTLNWEWEKQQSALTATTISKTELAEKNSLPIIQSQRVKKYLILANSSYSTHIEKFARWKRTLGFDVSIAYKNTWTNSDILEEINKYEQLDYLLLIGDNISMRGNVINCIGDGVERSVLSDLPYSVSGSESLVPEISVGRIAVSSSKEEELVLDRIIEYEKNPPSNDKFYNSNLFLTSFLGTKTHANRRNSQTTYEISSYMKSLGKDVCNLFYANDGADPQYWNDYGQDENGYIISPAPIPFEMQKPQYPWNATDQDVLNRINAGYSQVFYFGHGSQNRWHAPLLDTSHLKTLTNGEYRPVVFSMACLTGDYSYARSFAEQFLTAPDGGAVAVFGFTGSTMQVYTDIIATSFYNGMFPNPGLSPIINDKSDGFSLLLSPGTQTISELGELHKFVVSKLNSSIPVTESSSQNKKYEAAMLTLFGDPSMHLYLDTPEIINPTSLISMTGDCTVIDSNPKHTITVYYPSNQQVMNTTGKVTVNISGSDKPIICVHAPGAIPVIYDFTSDDRNMVPQKNMENRIVKEGQIWRYHTNFNAFMPPYSDVYVDVRFSGTTEIDGREYANCYVSKSYEDFSEEDAALIAYMREENGKVYVRYIPSANKDAMDKGIDIEPHAPMIIYYNHDIEEISNYDVLLFDDSLGLGDLLYSTPDRGATDVFTVVEMSDFYCDGLSGKFWTLKLGNGDSYNYLEGIGSDYGLLPFPGAIPTTYSADTWDLDLVMDADGDVLFDAAKVTNGITVTENDSDVISELYTTLNGIRVSNPLSKGIYIRTQLLKNGNRRTNKVVVK